jgi:nucleotide-binding universal stress UspA family protein
MPVAAPAVEIALNRVMVTTDFSPCSDKALHYALARAHNYGATLYVMHVVSSLGYVLAGEEVAIAAEIAATRDMEQLQSGLAMAGALKGLPFRTVVRRGEVWPQLERLIEEEKIDLLVAGTHGRTGVRCALLGSVAENIFRHARCPVITVGPCVPAGSSSRADAKLKSILFATDFGHASLQALPYAMSLAHHNHARLSLLHVLRAPGPVWYEGSAIGKMRGTAEAKAMERLHGLISQLGEFEYYVQFGDPVEQILKTAVLCGADMIVMGVKKASPASAHLPWAIAHQIVSQAESPVLTVRG